ncbi:hypothetical protein VQH23_13645 [Pararoseomonas sp. SCSIO 73927]|uniref:hypothetical protein n=1 Tax=Pararoseomonas sp. SCSIO 73927 TaxID=3114537 RepID=UPI0030CCA015
MKEEIVTLANALRSCMRTMERAGFIYELANMFRGHDGAALNAAIRHLDSEYVIEMETRERRAQARLLEFERRYQEEQIVKGPKADTIHYKDHCYRCDRKGFVLRDGVKTGMRIDLKDPYYVLAETKRHGIRPRRHQVEKRGMEMALLDAAMLILERQRGVLTLEPIDFAHRMSTPKRRKLPPP